MIETITIHIRDIKYCCFYFTWFLFVLGISSVAVGYLNFTQPSDYASLWCVAHRWHLVSFTELMVIFMLLTRSAFEQGEPVS